MVVICGNSTVLSVFLSQGILMFSLIKYTRITYEDYVYPPWGEAVGWLITVASMLCVPLLVSKTIVDIYWRGNDGGNTSQMSVRPGFAPLADCYVTPPPRGNGSGTTQRVSCCCFIVRNSASHTQAACVSMRI